MERAQRQERIGIAIALLSLGMFFWWGIHFHVFGTKPDLSFGTFGFIFWLAAMAFGTGYTAGGWRTGAKTAVQFCMLLLVAWCIGAAWRAFAAPVVKPLLKSFLLFVFSHI